MELYIGGYAQGKLDRVKQVHEGEEFRIVEDYGELSEQSPDPRGRLVVYGLHRMIRELMSERRDPGYFFEELFTREPGCILICDEVGNGIVPMTQKDREYRDAVGEILILAAKKAERVERVICGLGQRIK